MKKVVILILFSMVALMSFASVSDLAGMIPTNSSNVFVCENLDKVYSDLKETVLVGTVMNTLGIEMILKQYVEITAYNQGLDPEEIYNSLGGDIAFSLFDGSEMIFIMGPVDKPEAVKEALTGLLGLGASFGVEAEVNIQISGSYIYIGSLDAYASTQKGFDVNLITSDNENVFGINYMKNDDIESITEMSVENSTLIIDTIAELVDPANIDLMNEIVDPAGIHALIDSPHLNTGVIMFKMMSFENYEKVVSVLENNIAPILGQGGDLVDLDSLKEVLNFVQEYVIDLEGSAMVDIALDTEALLGSMMAMPTADGEVEANPIDVVVRVGYNASEDKLKSLLDALEMDYVDEGDYLRMVPEEEEGFEPEAPTFLWVDNNMAYFSLKDKPSTMNLLNNSENALESDVYYELADVYPLSGTMFFEGFMDVSTILGSLLGMEFDSGIYFGASYSDPILEGVFVLK